MFHPWLPFLDTNFCKTCTVLQYFLHRFPTGGSSFCFRFHSSSIHRSRSMVGMHTADQPTKEGKGGVKRSFTSNVCLF